jgi:hypothetical protein
MLTHAPAASGRAAPGTALGGTFHGWHLATSVLASCSYEGEARSHYLLSQCSRLSTWGSSEVAACPPSTVSCIIPPKRLPFRCCGDLHRGPTAPRESGLEWIWTLSRRPGLARNDGTFEKFRYTKIILSAVFLHPAKPISAKLQLFLLNLLTSLPE